MAHEEPGSYITFAVTEVPSPSEHGTKSEVAQMRAWCPHNPCHEGYPQPFKTWGQDQKGRTREHGGYITFDIWGSHHRFKPGNNIRSGPNVGLVANPCRMGGPQRFRSRNNIKSGPQ